MYSWSEVKMNSSVDTYQKRLRDEVSLVEQEIESHNQEVESLNGRLEGLKRALELCDSEESAIAELLRTGVPGLELGIAKSSRVPAPASQKSALSRKAPMRRETVAAARNARRGGKGATPRARVSGDGAIKRIDMIGAALKRHPRLTVRELIAALDRDFGWKCGESNLTAHLYTNPELFSHTKADRAGKQLVTWSLR
jgi:hypothetical protein